MAGRSRAARLLADVARIKTLAVRMDRHSANAMHIAEFLQGPPKMSGVLPGLPNHPGHDIARKQMRDFGGMVSFLAASGRERPCGSSSRRS